MTQSTESEFVTLLRDRGEQLRSEAAKIDEQRAYLQAEYTRREAQLRERVERLEEELLHIDQILELRDGSRPQGQVSPPPISKVRNIEDAVYNMLASEGHGIHYRTILERLNGSGVVVPGKNPGATLVSQLIRDGRFSRPKQRGVYALREWAPNAKNVGARGRKPRRRTRLNA